MNGVKRSSRGLLQTWWSHWHDVVSESTVEEVRYLHSTFTVSMRRFGVTRSARNHRA